VIAATLAAATLAIVGYAAAPFPASFRSTPRLRRQGDRAGAGDSGRCCWRGRLPARPFYVLLLSSLYGAGLILSCDSFLTLFLAWN